MLEETIKEFRGKYDFLSNFFLSPFELKGKYAATSGVVRYPTVEHLYQASKTIDPEVHNFIAGAATAGKTKARGQSIVLRPDWDVIKVDVMEEALKAKFDQNESLKIRLIHTGTALLQEGNLWGDVFWGVSITTGKGLNLLGILLMKIRAEYQFELAKQKVKTLREALNDQ